MRSVVDGRSVACFAVHVCVVCRGGRSSWLMSEEEASASTTEAKASTSASNERRVSAKVGLSCDCVVGVIEKELGSTPYTKRS